MFETQNEMRKNLDNLYYHGQVRMGFGLHIGWGIEGPVGSMQKVDATYLSPHVNMAARCETAAKQWHVPVSFFEKDKLQPYFITKINSPLFPNHYQLLCTDVFYACLSKAAQKYMRQVDKVLVKGSATPMNMYTFDAFQDQIMIDKDDKKAWGHQG